MAITLVPIHKSGAHQRSLQVASMNDTYAEIRRHAKIASGEKTVLNNNVMFQSSIHNPIVKFVIINDDKVEVIAVNGFNRINV